LAAAPAFLVDSTDDAVDDNVNDTVCHTAAGTCTLRAAIMQANRYAGSGSVAITLPAGTYTLSVAIAGANGDDSGDLNLTVPPGGSSPLTITGAGAASTIIDANQIDRAFSVSRVATISGVTIRNGLVSSGNGGAILSLSDLTLTHAVVELSQANQGGGIENDGFMTLTDVVLQDNSANLGGGIYNGSNLTVSRSTIKTNSAPLLGGGGVFNVATLSVDQSTISANTAISGGGIYNYAPSASTIGITMTNSTVSGNHAQGKGGGVLTGGQGTVNVAIFSSSIIANEAAANPVSGGRGGGLSYTVPGTSSLHNSLIAGNYLSGGSSYEDCYSPSALINAYGKNLFSADPSAVCAFTNPSSVGSTTMIFIGSLQNNGGPTFTHALLAGSNAIGAVTSANCTGADALPVPMDQRGVLRQADGFCDVGAFEYDFSRIFGNGFEPQ
jgi:CSLREA domain-containing protein